MALNLYGVTVSDAHALEARVPGTETIVVRDIAAICGETEYRAAPADDAALQRYNQVISAFVATSPVLPAPIGVVFKSADAVKRWLELHYGALTGAMTYVENRVAGRVHISRKASKEEAEVAIDVAAVAAESLRVLRRAAVATLPQRADKSSGVVLSAAFLIEQEAWKDFTLEVEAQARMVPGFRFELTGPWPPYDFVQMQLGS